MSHIYIINYTYYDPPREDCSGYYEKETSYTSLFKAKKAFKWALKTYADEPVGISTNFIKYKRFIWHILVDGKIFEACNTKKEAVRILKELKQFNKHIPKDYEKSIKIKKHKIVEIG